MGAQHVDNMVESEVPAVGQRVFLLGTSKWYGAQEYEAHVVDIGTGDKAGTIKVQYNDGGYKRFPIPEYNKLIVPERDEIDEFGTHDYEWADDQYSPAKEMEMETELGQIKIEIKQALEQKDFLLADQLQKKMLGRKAASRVLKMERQNLMTAVKRENFLLAHETQQRIDALMGEAKAEAKADTKAAPAKGSEKGMAEILGEARDKAFRGGMGGVAAGMIQVCSLMWLRTTMNYQYRYGGSAKDALKTLYSQGGIPRFYRGIAPALITAPLSRFGDTAANVGVLTLLENSEQGRDLPIFVKTFMASTAAAGWRVMITPIDTLKTTMQVEGKEGLKNLKTKLRVGGPTVMFHGAIGNMSATMAGYIPWFTTYNYLDAHMPMPVDKVPKLARYAGMGFAASVVSDCTSNSIRVLKVYRQTSAVTISYPEAAKAILQAEGLQGLFLRGLGTRLFTNGVQSMAFSVAWKYFSGAV